MCLTLQYTAVEADFRIWTLDKALLNSTEQRQSLVNLIGAR